MYVTLDMEKIKCNAIMDYRQFLVYGLFLSGYQPLILIWPSISKDQIFFKNHESNSEALICYQLYQFYLILFQFNMQSPGDLICKI